MASLAGSNPEKGRKMAPKVSADARNGAEQQSANEAGEKDGHARRTTQEGENAVKKKLYCHVYCHLLFV